jgi:tape measure domain-containing protein
MSDTSRLVIEVDSKGVMKATGNLEVFEKILNKTSKGSKELSDKMGALQLITNKLPGPFKSVASALMGIINPATAVTGAIIEVGEAAIKYVKESVEAFSKFEMIKTNLEVVSSSAEEASRIFNDLQKMAGRTPFNVAQLAEAATMLRQTGMSANELIPTLEMLGNVSGGSAEKFSRISVNFAQIQSTMKATSMDIRQFATAGVPIYKMLEEMGVQGTATANDISEAFKRMTQAGGQFYNAMEKGAQTITGLKTNLEGLKEQSKALQAEIGGMAGITKDYYERQIEGYKYLLKILQERKVLLDLENKKKSGTPTALEEYEFAQNQLEKYSKQLDAWKEKKGTFLYAFTLGDTQISYLEKTISDYQKIKDKFQPMIDAHNELNKKQEEYNALLEKSETGYRNLQSKIEETYAKTTEGQKEAVENEIEWWRTELQRMRYVDVKAYDGSELRVIGKKQVGIEDKEKKQIEAIIRMIQEGKKKLTSWQKTFKSVMNLSDTDTEQRWFSSQTAAINKFAQTLSTVQERAKILSVTIGTDFAGSIEKAAEQWEQLASEMILSGEWQSNNNLFLQVIEYAREARETLGEANLDKLIVDTNKEIDLLKLTSVEMEKQRLMSEYHVSNENKINELLSRQNALRREQQRQQIVSQATGIPEEFLTGTGEELGKNISYYLSDKKFDSEYFSAEGLSDYADDLASILDTWENLYKSITAAKTIKDGTIIQLFDPALEENYNLIQKIREEMNEARSDYGKAYVAKLIKELDEAGKSTYELAVNRLVIEQKISKEAAKQAIEVKKQIDYITNGYDIMGAIMTSIDDALRSIRSGEGGYGQYAGGLLAKSGMEAIQGSDAGNFAQGAARGGWIAGLINMFVGALAKAVGGMEGFNEALNPITGLFSEMKTTLKALLLPGVLVSRLFVELGKGLDWLLNILTFGLNEQLASTYCLLVGTNDERQKEEERLRALNEQYANLYKALKEQEEYYLQQRRHLNSEWAIENFQNVNDMILSPHGIFRTDPEDYIIATKNPETLMSGGSAPVYINIENNGAKVSAQESTTADGTRQIKIIVDSVVQHSILNGDYDGSFDAMSARRNGKRTTA